jgi:hypothetical protein
LFESIFGFEVNFHIILEIFETSYPIKNHVQSLGFQAFTQPFVQDGSFTISENVASHINHHSLSMVDSIKYTLSVIDICRIGASEKEVKNSAKVKGKRNNGSR